jgi:hypothetical protein
MFTQEFSLNGFSGTVVRRAPRRAERIRVQYVAALIKCYPELQKPLAQVFEDVLGTRTFGQVNEFGRMAATIQTIQGLPFEWPAPDADPDAIKRAFEAWLDDDEEDEHSLFKSVSEAIARLARPNGVEGSAAEQLSEEERADPLSERSA